MMADRMMHPTRRLRIALQFGTVVAAATLLFVVGRSDAVGRMAAIFVSILAEGIPFVILGALIAGLVQEFVAGRLVERLSREASVGTIVLTSLSGFVFPVCECAIVPAMRRLRRKGMSLSHCITFLVGVPLLNPVVIASTAVALAYRPELIVARFAGGFVVAVAVGLLFMFLERQAAENHEPNTVQGDAPVATLDSVRTPIKTRITIALDHTVAEFVEIVGYFTAGALITSAVQVFVPPEWFLVFRANLPLAMVTMIGLAFLLSVCSEADAFIGQAFLAVFPAPAVLAFLIFGPMFDLKNLLLLRRVLTRFETTTLAVSLFVLVMLVGGLYAAITS